jgi:hypothetical protein
MMRYAFMLLLAGCATAPPTTGPDLLSMPLANPFCISFCHITITIIKGGDPEETKPKTIIKTTVTPPPPPGD